MRTNRSVRANNDQIYIPISLPKPADPTLGKEDFYIGNAIFDQVTTLLQKAKQQHITLEPNLKFRRNIGKKGKVRKGHDASNVSVQTIRPIGTMPIPSNTLTFHGRLQHSILIQHTLDAVELNHDQVKDTETLGVYLLCAAKKVKFPDKDIGVGFRNRMRQWTDETFSNQVVKYAIYLGSLEDFLNSKLSTPPEDFTKNPTLAVYKRKTDIEQQHSTLHENLNKNLNYTSEFGPYLGHSLYDISRSRFVDLSEKIQMCIAFFEYIASEYEKNSNLAFCDIKPDNFSYDLTNKTCVQCDKKAIGQFNIATKHYFINGWDRTEKNMPSHDLFAMGHTLFDIIDTDQNLNCGGIINQKKETAYCELIKLAENIKKKATKHNIFGSNDTQDSNQEYIKKHVLPLLTEIQGNYKPTSNIKTQPNNRRFQENLKKASQITPTNDQNSDNTEPPKQKPTSAEPKTWRRKGLRKPQTNADPDFFQLAINYLEKDNQVSELKTPSQEGNQAVFACAILGAKAYLDQHQRKNTRSKGKVAVEKFLTAIAKIDPDSQPDDYFNNVHQLIEQTIQKNESAPSSRLFSSSSRRQVLRSYCALAVVNNEDETISPLQRANLLLREKTKARLTKTLQLDEHGIESALGVFLGNQTNDLRSRILEKAVQYLECSKAGYFGRKAVRQFVGELLQQSPQQPSEEENVTAAYIKGGIESITQGGFFSRATMRKEFFKSFLPNNQP